MRRKLLLVALVFVAVLLFSGTAIANGNQYGVADRREISLDQPTWVGDVFLPAGKYEVRHTMEGADHFMVFRRMYVKRPAEARVKCTLVPSTVSIKQTEIGFRQNAANERVLNRLAFEGDRAEHLF